MAWSNKQKQLAARACAESRISEEQRRDMILRNFANAWHGGRFTSTAPKLSNPDYANFMAIVEGYAGGKILHFTRGYWRDQANNCYRLMREKVQGIAAKLEAAGLFQAGGASLAGWISKRVTKGTTDRLEDLDYHGLLALVIGLQAFARQRSVTIDADAELEKHEMEPAEDHARAGERPGHGGWRNGSRQAARMVSDAQQPEIN